MTNLLTNEKDPRGETWTLTHVTDETIRIKRSEHVKGTNRYSGKTFSRFKDRGEVILSRRDGTPRYYTRNPKIGMRQANHLLLDFGHKGHGSGANEEVLKLAAAHWGWNKRTLLDFYPLALDFQAAPGVTPLLTSADIQEMTKKAFGSGRYRKDLVRAVAQVPARSSEYIPFAAALSRVAPVDWVIPFLKQVSDAKTHMGGAGFAKRDQQALIRLFRGLRPNSQRQIMSKPPGSLWNTTDILRSWRMIERAQLEVDMNPLKFQNWHQLHDYLAATARKAQYPKQDIKYTKKAASVAGSYDGFEIIPAETTHDLIEWGELMSNCIGSYRNAALSGSSLLYAITREGQVIANMELNKKGRINQLLGKHNRNVDPDLYEKVESVVESVYPPAPEAVKDVDGAGLIPAHMVQRELPF